MAWSLQGTGSQTRTRILLRVHVGRVIDANCTQSHSLKFYSVICLSGGCSYETYYSLLSNFCMNFKRFKTPPRGNGIFIKSHLMFYDWIFCVLTFVGNYIHISKMEKEVFAITKFILLSLKGNQADVTIWEGSLAGQRMPEWATSNWVCLQLVEIANLIT